MPRRDSYPDDDTVPVIVPRSDRRLVPTPPERVRKLRERLAALLARMRVNEPASSVPPGPDGFATRVAAAACTLCKGWCCKNGDDDGFLDEATLARVWPDMTADAIVRMYVALVPDIGYAGSCIFHGERGCTLPRDSRSNVCNVYFCGGLHAFIQSSEKAGPTIVIAGELDSMRLSPVLVP
jgi:hypothetical protein